MITILTNARVLTLDDGSTLVEARRGSAMSTLGVLGHGEVWIDRTSGAITRVGKAGTLGQHPANAEVIDCYGHVLMPGFVDCHTHACFAGDRLDEWELKRQGVLYLEIAKRGGGIMSTVRAVRQASESELAAVLADRLFHMLCEGTTTVEIKSGYGLSTEDELKMLRAISLARYSGGNDRRACAVMTVIPTALIGHSIDHEKFGDGEGGTENFVDYTINETLPAVSAEFPEMCVDAFCEKTAWSREQCIRLFKAARAAGHPCRVHVDQFNELGLLDDVEPLGLRSVDHLEATSPDSLARLAKTNAVGVLLPCAGFHTDGRYANGRALIDHGGAAAIATNYNPGSAPCFSMPMAIALAVRHCGLSVAEAICACTVNAAAVLGLNDRGVISPGLRADLICLRHSDERMLAYEFGGRHVDMVFCAGSRVA